MKSLSKKNRSILSEIRSEEFTIDHDNFDIKNFQELLVKNPKIARLYIEGSKEYPQFKNLQQDVYDSLYKYGPKKVHESDIQLEYLLNSQIMDAVVDSNKYKELRLMTRLDKVNSAVGSEVLGNDVKDLVDKLREEFEDALNNAKQAQKQVDDEQGQGKGEQPESEGGAGDQEGKGQEFTSLEEAQKKLEESMKTLNNFIDERERRQIDKMLDNALSETKETSDMITNWGLEQDPSYSKAGYQQKLKLIERLKSSKKLQEISKLAGRYKRLAVNSQKEKIRKGADSLYDIVTGNDLGRVLSSEAMKLRKPILKTLFMKEYLEESLLQYEYQGKERKGNGPMICCIDSSGSMGGIPEIWAKSVAMGLLDISRQQKRSFMVIHFDASSKESLHTNTFDKNGSYNIEEVLDMAEYFTSGGTLFEPSLDLARDKIEQEKDFEKADIVFITDGESTIRPNWLSNFKKWKSEKNVKIQSILIDMGYNFQGSLDLFSDSVTKLRELTSSSLDELATDIFKNI
jgi:uncharacterized protein with von Willebrand factor type A (vWA) domain